MTIRKMANRAEAPDFAAMLPRDAANANVPRRWELATRIVFGVALAALALAANIVGGWVFAGFIGLGALSAIREWHRMIEPSHFGWEFAVTATSVVGALIIWLMAAGTPWPWLMLCAGGAASAALAAARRGLAVWQAFGAIYIGAAALCLVAIRTNAQHGLWVIFGLFIVIWATDTGGLLSGRLIGGPKLVPKLSPNKTWAGFVGGIALAAAAEAAYVFWLKGNPFLAVVYAICLALVACGGDLFESWTKRIFNRKNSGSLIPGHGGVLDRIDSTLFVAPVSAVLVMLCGIDPLFGAHL